ncbi:MAG: DUF6655 family protein [Limisphaerales bacterium]
MKIFLAGALAVLIAWFGGGCSAFNMTQPPRSATEQLLLSTSADRALRSIGENLTIFANKKVFLDSSNFDSYDSKYVIGDIRDALSRAGALLVDSRTNSDFIVEARSGALSIDEADSLFGIPKMSLPIPLSGPLEIPELALYKSQKQHSIAKLALFAYSTHSRKHFYSSGPMVGKSYNTYFKIMGFITHISGDIPEKQKTEKKEQEQEAREDAMTPPKK